MEREGSDSVLVLPKLKRKVVFLVLCVFRGAHTNWHCDVLHTRAPEDARAQRPHPPPGGVGVGLGDTRSHHQVTAEVSRRGRDASEPRVGVGGVNS